MTVPSVRGTKTLKHNQQHWRSDHPDRVAEEQALAKTIALWKKRNYPVTKAEELDIEKRWLLFSQIDSTRFIYFFDKYFNMISRFVQHVVIDDVLTQDLVSKTFFHALNNLSKFRWQGVTFGAWLFRIAVNEIKTYQRNRSYWQNDLSQDIEDKPHKQSSPLDEIILSEDKSRLRQCLNRLDEKSRDILILSFWEEMSSRQIAAILDLPVGTVKVTKMRAKEALREMMSEKASAAAASQADSPPRLRIVGGNLTDQD